MSERRIYPRVPLDTPIFVNVSLPDFAIMTMIVTDISCGGAQLAFPPTVQGGNHWLDAEVVLSGLPPIITKENISGNISWISPERCGIKFHRVLSMDNAALQLAFSSF